MTDWAIVLHGGEYSKPEGESARQEQFLRELLPILGARLANGESALEAATETVRAMEDSGFFNAGKGAVANAHGDVELDAAVMDGASSRAGAVAAIRGFRNPVLCARTVMERTNHVLLAGPLAERFLRDERLEETPAYYFANARLAEHGTIGALALDKRGNLAAATSTGGISGKLPGRVGDSPLIGAGTFANKYAAVSCTGQGEYFIRSSAASRIALRMEQGGLTIGEAARETLDGIEALGGTGGLIALSRDGSFAKPFNTRGMVCGWATPGEYAVEV